MKQHWFGFSPPSFTSHSEHSSSHVAVIVGAGDATGSAIVKKFAREGYAVVMARRNGEKLESICKELQHINVHTGTNSVPFVAVPGPVVWAAFSCDARQESEVEALMSTVERDIGPIKFFCHNIGANVRFNVTETTARVYRKTWEMAAFSAFLCCKQATQCMLKHERPGGTIIVTGATASTRGNPGFSAFAGALHAKRALVQSLAKEVGPEGIHVAHVIIDGAIDTQFVKELMGEKTFQELKSRDGIVRPQDIAETYWWIHNQPRSAWTFEMDIRPYREKF